MTPAPEHILIIGAGVFGISTALSLLSRERYDGVKRITVVDSSPSLPNPTGSSVDSSRIVRADYAAGPYARLAVAAQRLWRDRSVDGWGGEGRYHEPGFLLTADKGREAYVEKSLATVSEVVRQAGGGEEQQRQQGRRPQIEVLRDQEAICRASGYETVSGDVGYVNWGSGWADAEACVAWAVEQLKKRGGDRVVLRNGVKVARLVYEMITTSTTTSLAKSRCVGVELDNGEMISSDLTVVAAGAWTPTLIDLHGRAVATGQALAYLDISEEEQRAMEQRPTVMNMSRGLFIIPPRNRKLKVARHGFGYRNPRKIKIETAAAADGTPDDVWTEVSVPDVEHELPLEGREVCTMALRDFLPHMVERGFSKTRICWYCDTYVFPRFLLPFIVMPLFGWSTLTSLSLSFSPF